MRANTLITAAFVAGASAHAIKRSEKPFSLKPLFGDSSESSNQQAGKRRRNVWSILKDTALIVLSALVLLFGTGILRPFRGSP